MGLHSSRQHHGLTESLTAAQNEKYLIVFVRFTAELSILATIATFLK